MMKKILSLIGVVAFVLCGSVMAERYYAADGQARTASKGSQSDWKQNWELALTADDAAAYSLSREDEEEVFEESFGDFSWDAGWDSFN